MVNQVSQSRRSLIRAAALLPILAWSPSSLASDGTDRFEQRGQFDVMMRESYRTLEIKIDQISNNSELLEEQFTASVWVDVMELLASFRDMGWVASYSVDSYATNLTTYNFLVRLTYTDGTTMEFSYNRSAVTGYTQARASTGMSNLPLTQKYFQSRNFRYNRLSDYYSGSFGKTSLNPRNLTTVHHV